MESYLLPGHLLRHFFILGGVYIKKRILCFILSVLVVLSAYSSASYEAEQVSAAVVVDDAIAIAALLAACGIVYVGATVTDDGYPTSEELDDLIEEAWIDRVTFLVTNGSFNHDPEDFDPENDNPEDKPPSTWEKFKQWLFLHPGESLAVTGTALGMLILGIANALKDDVDSNLVSISDFGEWNVYSGMYNPLPSDPNFTNGYNYYYDTYLMAIAYIGGSYVFYTNNLNTYYGADFIINFAIQNERLCGWQSVSSNPTNKMKMGRGGGMTGSDYIYLSNSSDDWVMVRPEVPIYFNDTLVGGEDLFNSENVKFGSTLQTDENGDITALPVPSINAGNLADNWDSLSSNLGTAVNTGGDVQSSVDAIIDAVGTPSSGTGTGSDSTEDPDSGEDSNTDTSGLFQTLWDWLRKILEAILALPQAMIDLLVNFFQTLWEWLRQILDAILSLPEFLSGLFQTLWNWLQSIIDAIANGAASLAQWAEQIWDSICNLPEAIGDLIKSIFVPDTAELQAIYDDLNESVGNIFGIDNYDLDNLWSDSGPPDDIYGDLDFGSYHYSGVIASFRFLIDGVDKFRKYIRGFVVLMLVIYNIRQALSMFGLSSGEIAAAHAYDTSHGNKYSGGGN